MSVPRARLLDLMKARCEVFATNYNPDGVRMGNKVLRQRLRGPALASWYPRKTVGVSDVMKLHPKLTTWNDKEQDRREYIEELKARNKGAPAKKGPPAPKPPPGAGKKK